MRSNRIPIIIQVIGLASGLWPILVDARAIRFAWPFILAEVVALLATFWHANHPSKRTMVLAYFSVAAMVPCLAYGVIRWPWIAPGGAPLGRESWTAIGLLTTVANLFIALPLVLFLRPSIQTNEVANGLKPRNNP